jgi:hypothetical protein
MEEANFYIRKDMLRLENVSNGYLKIYLTCLIIEKFSKRNKSDNQRIYHDPKGNAEIKKFQIANRTRKIPQGL